MHSNIPDYPNPAMHTVKKDNSKIEVGSKQDKTNGKGDDTDHSVSDSHEVLESANITALDAGRPSLFPKEFVAKLDRYIIGQRVAKRKFALALRQRKQRMKLDPWLRKEVKPKNIIFIGPSGCGKTAMVKRGAELENCPFIKVEATKFTEVGYIGRDVDSIPRDLVDSAFKTLREAEIAALESQVKEAAIERILNCFIRPPKKERGESLELQNKEQLLARNLYRSRLLEGLLDETEVEIELASQSVGVEIMGPPGMEEMTNQLQNMMQQLTSSRVKTHRMKVKDALVAIQQEEAAKLLNEDDLKRRAVAWVEQYGIVFIDEIDKVCRRSDTGSDISREGVQRDLLPLIEGSTVSTKYGTVRTDHILFIAAGAFHLARPSDLIPELQGRFPIRVSLNPLTAKDFERILRETHASLIVQYQALLKTEDVVIHFTDAAISRIAEIAYLVNEKTENTGARRLYTIMESLLEDILFEASETPKRKVTIEVDYVNKQLMSLIEDEDSSHYIL